MGNDRRGRKGHRKGQSLKHKLSRPAQYNQRGRYRGKRDRPLFCAINVIR